MDQMAKPALLSMRISSTNLKRRLPMPSQSSTPSTGRPAAYSGGASANGCTTRWIQDPLHDFDLPTRDGEWLLSWKDDNGYLIHTVLLNVQQTAAEPETPLPASAWQRLLCHAAVSRIPEQGLPDAVIQRRPQARRDP